MKVNLTERDYKDGLNCLPEEYKRAIQAVYELRDLLGDFDYEEDDDYCGCTKINGIEVNNPSLCRKIVESALAEKIDELNNVVKNIYWFAYNLGANKYKLVEQTETDKEK